ncbi:hypothetical protein OSB04_030704 [Centaurea solstitialis]|uniref:Uncharacterized protein n=1 Tax=Centaurea solstitialis TaxID=347529 RepID=A0AA38SKD0_9ASTR|nr:hypothetical protein OSB04_030704 [Centaurea solstitialis]
MALASMSVEFRNNWCQQTRKRFGDLDSENHHRTLQDLQALSPSPSSFRRIKFIAMSKRPVNLSRRLGDGAAIPFMRSLHPKSRPSPLLSIGLVLVGAFLIIGYVYSGSGGSSTDKATLSRLEAGSSCSSEIYQALPHLKKAYGDSMHRVLHVGPNTCSVGLQVIKRRGH